MKSSTLLAVGTGLTLSSFAVPPLGVPLLIGAVASFVAGEIAVRHEEKYHKPVQQRRYASWLEMLDDAFLYRLGVTQGLARAEIDWSAHHYKSRLNLQGTVEDKYFTLFTAGRPQQAQPPQEMEHGQGQTIDVPSEPVAEAEQPQRGQNGTEQDTEEDLTSLFAGASPLPEDGAVPVAAEVVLEGELVAKQVEPVEAEVQVLNLQSLMRTAFLLIWGTPGGGKSTLARRIARMRETNGQAITIADPHGSKLDWGNWKVIGSGRDFEKLNQYLGEYDESITEGYEQYAVGKRDFAYSTLVVDEFTQWSDECEAAPKFVKAVCSDIRKLHKCVIVISHADTITGLGGATGMRAAIDRAAVKLELETKINRNDGEYEATGYGWLQYPGMPRERVKIPNVQF